MDIMDMKIIITLLGLGIIATSTLFVESKHKNRDKHTTFAVATSITCNLSVIIFTSINIWNIS